MRVCEEILQTVHHIDRDFAVFEDIQPFLGGLGCQDFTGLGIGFVDVRDPRCQVLETLVLDQVFPTGFLTEGLPMVVHIRKDGNVPVFGFIRLAMVRHQPCVTRLVQGRFKGLTPKVFGHDKRHHGLKHGDLDLLTDTCSFAVEKSCQD